MYVVDFMLDNAAHKRLCCMQSQHFARRNPALLTGIKRWCGFGCCAQLRLVVAGVRHDAGEKKNIAKDITNSGMSCAAVSVALRRQWSLLGVSCATLVTSVIFMQ